MKGYGHCAKPEPKPVHVYKPIIYVHGAHSVHVLPPLESDELTTYEWTELERYNKPDDE